MRNFIFRGKRIDNGERVEGFLSKGRLQGYEGNTLTAIKWCELHFARKELEDI